MCSLIFKMLNCTASQAKYISRTESNEKQRRTTYGGFVSFYNYNNIFKKMGFCVLHLSVIHFKWPWLTSYFQLVVVTHFSGSCHCGEETMVDTVTF